MDTTALSPAGFGLAGQAVRAIRCSIGDAIAACARERRRAARRRELAALSDHTLRDLGIDRAEIDSVLAECEGRAPWTRIRALDVLLSVSRS